MEKIGELINRLCKKGVEFKEIGELFIVKNGYTPSKNNNEFWDNGNIPWFRMEDIRSNGRILKDSIQHVTEKAIKGNLFKKNSLMVATTATIGVHALIETDFLCNQQLTCVTIKDNYQNDIDIKFYFYYFDLVDKECIRIANQGGGMPIVSIEKMKKLKVPVPPLEVQRVIVGILDKLSNLTTKLTDELTSELNFRKLQLDFYKNSLFNFSEDIDYVDLGDMCDLVTKQTGFDYTKSIKSSLIKEKKDNTLPYIQTKFFSGRKFEYETDYYIPIDIAKKFPKILLNQKCILFSIVGASIGNVGLFDGEKECFLGGAICVAKVSKEYNVEYLYHYLTSHQGQKQIFSKVKGAGQATVTIEDIRKFRIPLPSIEIQNEIVQTLNNLDDLVNNIVEIIPTEIEKRQKQYEYYRNKLLSFKEVETNE